MLAHSGGAVAPDRRAFVIEPSPLDRYDLGQRPAFLGGSVAETPDVLRVRALPRART